MQSTIPNSPNPSAFFTAPIATSIADHIAETITNTLQYNPNTGAITRLADGHNAITYQNKTVSPLRHQNMNALPIRKSKSLPTHTGYNTYSLDEAIAKGIDKQRGVLPRYFRVQSSPYNPDNPYTVIQYFVKRKPITPIVIVYSPTTKKTYSIHAQTCAYYLMGVIANPRAIKARHHTNRDGDQLNLTWCNIRPPQMNISQPMLNKSKPSIPKRPVVRQKLGTKKVYRFDACIKHIYDDGSVALNMGRGFPMQIYSSQEKAFIAFSYAIKQMKGTKQRLRDGSILVTR